MSKPTWVKRLTAAVPRGLVLAALMLSGCAINSTPEYESVAVRDICAAHSGDTLSVSHKGQTKRVTVHLTESWEELYNYCGSTGGACVYRSAPWDTMYEYCQTTGGDCAALEKKAVSRIYMIKNNQCARLASHELGHVFDIQNLDAIAQASYRTGSFAR